MSARVASRLDFRLQADVDHPLALALSGGGDSMALLVIAANWAKTRGRRLLAITVDHGLNPASADWSRLCERAAAEVGADWIERRWEGDKPMAGLTAAARAARHSLIAEAAREAGARVVLFAHTADDIAESDWMRAQSMQDGGSTLGALREWSPSPAWPEGRGLMLLRPMLGERRGNLRALLSTSGKDWIEDPANSDVRFGRSRARSALLPLGEGGSAIAETDEGRVFPVTHGQSGPSPFCARTTADAAVRSSPLPLGEGFKVAREISVPELAATLLCASGRSEPPKGDSLHHLSARLQTGEDFTATLCGARIAASGAEIVIGREPGEFRRRAAPDIALVPGQAAVWDGRFEIIARDPGWTVTAAAGRLNRLSDADRAVLNTVPAWARPALPVLIRDGGDAPVLAWRRAEVRVLAPRRLALFRGAASALAGGVSGGETTQEADLARTIHGETPPPDLFS